MEAATILKLNVTLIPIFVNLLAPQQTIVCQVTALRTKISPMILQRLARTALAGLIALGMMVKELGCAQVLTTANPATLLLALAKKIGKNVTKIQATVKQNQLLVIAHMTVK